MARVGLRHTQQMVKQLRMAKAALLRCTVEAALTVAAAGPRAGTMGMSLCVSRVCRCRHLAPLHAYAWSSQMQVSETCSNLQRGDSGLL